MSRLSALLALWWPCALVLVPFAVALLFLLIRLGAANVG
jgi:hypothetical protein